MANVFDLHCDTPHNIDKKKFNHIIPEKLYEQNYFGAVFAHFIVPKAKYPFVDAVRLVSTTMAYVNKKKEMQIVDSYRKLDKKKVNIILGVEGGHIFDNTFKQIEALYDLGVRVFTLTWNNSNKLAHSALEADKKGITKKGKEFFKELKNYNIIIDLSHASTKTVLDVCEVCENQIIASHSCVRALNPSFLRNIDDRAIKAIAEKEGVVGVNFSQYHLGGHSVIDHLDYLKDNFGIDVPAIGSDFDGINDAVIKNPSGVKDLEKELLKKGYKKSDVEKIFSGNFMKVFRKTAERKA
jgi:membrane dipeptidase